MADLVATLPDLSWPVAPPTGGDAPVQEPEPAPTDHGVPDVTAPKEPAWSPDSRPVAFVSAPAAAPALDEGPLPNGGFDHSVDGWEASNAALTLVQGLAGKAVRVTRTTTDESFAFYAAKELVTRRAGARYRVGAYVRSVSPGMFVCLRVEEYAGGAPITTERCRPAESGWRRVRVQGRTARKGTKLVFSIHVMAALGGTSFDVDGVNLAGGDALS